MTARELVAYLGAHQAIVLVCLGVLPLLAFVLPHLHGRDGGLRSPWRYVYAVLVVAAAAPGVLALMLSAYTFLFTGESLLDVNLLLYLGPLVSMVATLLLIGKNVPFEGIPGFDRLSGVFVMLAVTFLVLFALSRTRIWIVFGGSMFQLLLIAVALYAALQWGTRRALGRRA